jgi:putative ATP-dependent endonuclease of OLD family
LSLAQRANPGPAAFTELDLDVLTFLLGPNGAGKTAVLQALARLFSLDPAQRKIRKSDFHVPHDEKPDEAPAKRKLWIEADFESPELVGNGEKEAPAVPGNFAHMELMGVDGPAQVRFRLNATLDQDDDIEEYLTYVMKVDAEGNPLEQGRVAKHDRNAIQVHYLPARRDPADHISYSANALLGRALRSADWAGERDKISI